MIRTGIGYDIHRLAEERKLILGGVEIPHSHGLEGHSDADVLSHAIADALLGALGATKFLTDKRARVINVDVTLIAEASKIVPHVPEMRQKIADAIGASESDVSVKATTNEKLGPIGRGEGMAAIAIATIEITGSDD